MRKALHLLYRLKKTYKLREVSALVAGSHVVGHADVISAVLHSIEMHEKGARGVTCMLCCPWPMCAC